MTKTTRNMGDTIPKVWCGSYPTPRKEFPLFSGLAMYFPLALRAVSHLSLVGNQQHHKDEPLHWDRSKSTDEPDALMRHLFDCGPNWDNKDEDGEYHATKVAWRGLSLLEKVLEKTQETEEFRDIPNWEGYYQITKNGKVKSLARKWSPNESILTPTISYEGYPKVSLRNGKIKKQEEIHRLVALTYIDKDYVSKKLVCDHIDRNKNNNNLSNLRLVSFRENATNNGNDKLVGAYSHYNKWQSAITINNKRMHLGTFKTELEAHNRYKEELAMLEKVLEKHSKDV